MLKIGVDVGGTFTDFLVTREGNEPRSYKVLSTPSDPSIGLIDGLNEMAADMGTTLRELAPSISTIVHGTTVTTNAVLTKTGAKTALITTSGVRDALEMRRGIREEQYNNRCTNVIPIVPRYLRTPVRGRLDYRGDEIEPLVTDDIKDAIELYKNEQVEAVAICFMNAFANADHERQAVEIVRAELPDAYLSVSSQLLPSIRFYDRTSTTVLNSYVGPKLSFYLDNLTARLRDVGFTGVLLIMQSNGGVVSPEIARAKAAVTLLSGPAAGPGVGLEYTRIHGHDNCITVDMGGTSFDAALVHDGAPLMITEGKIDRHRIALPMLGIVTIGAGGGSIGWIDEGGLMRMGPQSAGADPGPACYGRGGAYPTCTDADLVLGYLNPDFFAGGKIPLDQDAARDAITKYIAKPMGLSLEESAAGMCRIINTNMAQGVREITIKRGYDPREFPLVVAGGAGPLHACMICQDLEIPVFIVPRESSIFCAAGMLMSDLKHDFMQSYVSALETIDWDKLDRMICEMTRKGQQLLASEGIPEDRRQFHVNLDCRYVKQYHEVSFPVSRESIKSADMASIASAFHAEHDRMYGYSLEDQATPIELINLRIRAVGTTDKPGFVKEEYAGNDASETQKGERVVYIPEREGFQEVPVYDGSQTRFGHTISGPAIIEQVNTTLFLSASFDCICDQYGSFVVNMKDKENPVAVAERENFP